MNKYSESIRSSRHRNQELVDDTTSTHDTRIKIWLPAALGAAINFFAANSITSTITMSVDGLATIFYVSAGAIFCNAIYMIVKAC